MKPILKYFAEISLEDGKVVEKVIILGSGPAGLSAAIYTAREDYKPLVISGFEAGGQLLLTTVVENFPGFPEGVDGTELITLMRRQAERFGTRFVDGNATEVDFTKKPFMVAVGENKYYAECIIIATGANAKWLGIESEKRLRGKGVSSCATCDGPFFKGKDVLVVGGGDTALEDANFLTKFAKSVTIVHRRDAFRASKAMQNKTFSNNKIKVLWNSEVEEILGEDKVTGAKIKNAVDGEVSEMRVDGVFIAIGYTPNTAIFNGKIKLDEKGYVSAIDEVVTSVDGIFVAGDVADHFYRQAATASGSGVKAALKAREYLSR